MSLCKIQNVDKFYSSEAGDVHALKRVNCEIDRGEFVVLAGPSGSGKSTLANIIGFLDTISAGAYVFDGNDISHLSENDRTLLRRDMVGFIFQSFNLMAILTVKENVAMASELMGVPTNKAQKNALEVLDMVGMGEYANRFPRQLSGGQQQRVSIARALVKKPALLIADEPTASLDSKNTLDTIKLLLDLNKHSNTACVVCTHDERVITVAPRLLYVEDGTLEEIPTEPKYKK